MDKPSPTAVLDPVDHVPALPRVRSPYERTPEERVNWKASIPFLLVHVIAVVGTLWFGITPAALVVFVLAVWGRMFFITGGYHRYFAHRAYRTNRAFQLVLAVGGATAAQKGPLWWAGHHRNHHRDSDTDLDIHSPLRGFWWSHVGWILCDRYDEVPVDRIRDFAKFPELRFVDKWNGLFPWALAITCTLVAGWPGLFFGFFMGTVVLWHGTFCVNSLAHVMGRRRYATDDTSRNSFAISLMTLGEGWHNNHHYFQSAARNGFFWWELDITWYILKALSWVGVVKDLKVPSREVLAANRVANGNFDVGMFKAHWAKSQAYVARARLDDGLTAAGARHENAELDLEAEKVVTDEHLHAAVAAAEALARTSRRESRAAHRRPAAEGADRTG